MLLFSKNDEAQKCGNTLGLLSNKSREGNIDMQSLAKNEFNFHGVELQPVPEMDGIWFTASQIGYALQYADDKAVQRIYSRHSDEFTDQMTRVVKVTTPCGEQLTRVFSLRGAHLIAMFARTPVAKEFRRWVLDILDREAQMGNVAPAFAGRVMLYMNEHGAVTGTMPLRDDEIIMNFDTFSALARREGWIVTRKEELEKQLEGVIQNLH